MYEVIGYHLIRITQGPFGNQMVEIVMDLRWLFPLKFLFK